MLRVAINKKIMVIGLLLCTGLVNFPAHLAHAQTIAPSVTATDSANVVNYDAMTTQDADAIPPVIQSSTNIKYLLEYAQQATDKKNFSAAVYAYTKASIVDPTNAMAHYGLGWAKLSAGISDYDDILKDLNQAIALNSRLTIAYNTRGLIYVLLSRYDNAVKDFSSAIALDNNFELAYTNRAYAKYNLQDYDGAILDYGIALVLNPGSPLAYNNRAIAKFANNDYQSALLDVNKALSLDPKFGEAYSNRASIKEAMNIDNSTDIVKAKTYGAPEVR